MGRAGASRSCRRRSAARAELSKCLAPRSTGEFWSLEVPASLGRPVAMELIGGVGFRTRVLARRVPPPSQRIPGV